MAIRLAFFLVRRRLSRSLFSAEEDELFIISILGAPLASLSMEPVSLEERSIGSFNLLMEIAPGEFCFELLS